MSLPQVAQLEINEEQQTQDNIIVHKTLLWDFDKGDFFLKDGKTVEVEGKEYLKVWIQKALLTVKDKSIYIGTQYGSEHHYLIGKVFKPSFMSEELKRMIREALLFNLAITNVDSFEFTQEGSKLIIKFLIRSIFGEINQEVRI
jgi:hypothetical protein